MYKLVTQISTETVKDIANRLSQENRRELALHLEKPEHTLTKEEVFNALLKQCRMRDFLYFILYDAHNKPQGIGGVHHEGNLFFVITNDCTRNVYISWLREANALLNRLQEYATNPVYCFSDSRNTLSHKWFKYAKLMHDEAHDIYLTDGIKTVPLYYYERDIISMAE